MRFADGTFTHREYYKDLGVCLCYCFKSDMIKAEGVAARGWAGVSNKGTLHWAVSECDVIYRPAQETPQYSEIECIMGVLFPVYVAVIVLLSEPSGSHSSNIGDHWSQYIMRKWNFLRISCAMWSEQMLGKWRQSAYSMHDCHRPSIFKKPNIHQVQ